MTDAILSSLPAEVAVIDRQGVILAVNEAWLSFARLNGVASEEAVSPGASYLEACEVAVARNVAGAAEAFAGIKAVCEGRQTSFKMDYVSTGSWGERSFAMNVVPLHRPQGGAVVAHWEVTNERAQERALRELSGRLITAQEDERRRIARELHDDLQQRLALLAMDLDAMASSHAPASGDDLSARARDLWRQAIGISTELHRLSYRLHPSKLEALGLLPTVQTYCRELSQRGLNVTFSHERVPHVMAPDIALCAFRVVQESLQNVLKHSGVAEARVTMTGADGHLHVRIEDAGRGFDDAKALGRAGLGLVSMRERVHQVGGTMKIQSGLGKGTCVQFSVPLTKGPCGEPAHEGTR